MGIISEAFDHNPMPRPATRSLKSLFLTHELALLMLVVVTGALGGAWAYFWQQTSVESVRLNNLTTAAQRIRTDLFRQIKEVTLARLMEDPRAAHLYVAYSRTIDENFNGLRQRTTSREEELAIQAMQRAYRAIQHDMNAIFTDPYLINQTVRLKILDPGYEQQMVGDFEQAFEAFNELLAGRQTHLERTMQTWTRMTPLALPLLVLLALGLLLWSRRSVQRDFVRPMAAVMDGARVISQGRLDHTIPAEGVEEMAELAKAINQMASDLSKSRDALVESEKQAALGALVPVVAHNIRNPLASIRASAQLLDPDDSPAELSEVKRAIIETVDRLGRWVSALVSYLHPLKPRRVATRPSAILRAALGLLQERTTEKGIQVAEAIDGEEPDISVDVDLMEQALYGLLSNAVDASPEGGMLTIEGRRSGKHYLLHIADQGPGMPFDPEPASLTPGPSTKRFGTGLGIPIAFKVCQAHGWRLAFAPGQDGGTLVTIQIPLSVAVEGHS